MDQKTLSFSQETQGIQENLSSMKLISYKLLAFVTFSRLPFS